LSTRDRVLDWVTAIVVAAGVVASIPMLPILLIGWLVIMSRSPGGGIAIIRGTRSAAEEGAPGTLEGFNGALVFPMVVAGWFLIALIPIGLLSGDPARPSGSAPALGLVFGTCVFVGPTFVAYRSMHPEIAGVPFSEWLGSREYGRLGVPLVTWIACCWLVWSITTWTTFVGGSWTTFCTFVLVCLVIVLPLVFVLIKPVGGRRLYQFIGVAIVVGLVSVGAYLAGLTPSPRWP
jgi:hypothetical protein